MGRFDQLDFDDDPSRRAPAPPPAAAAGGAEEIDIFGDGRGTPERGAAFFREQGDAAFRRDDLEEALRAYSRALEQDKTLYDGWFGQVRVLLENGEFHEADIWADKALDLFPRQPELLAVKAVASARMGKRTLALTQSDQAIALPATTPYVWLARADVLYAARRSMASQCLEKALLTGGTGAPAAWTHWEAARLLRRYGRNAQALDHARQASRELPGEIGAWLELARCQMALKMREAHESLKQALLIDRDNVAARRALRAYRPPGLLHRLLFFWR